MFKKILASLLVVISIFSLFTVGYATSANLKPQKVERVEKVDITKYQVNTPGDHSSSAKNKVVLISGTAPKDTSIVIEVYGAVDLTGKNYTLAKLPKDEDYILISSQTIKSGPAGFGEEVELIMGINKIIITFKVDGVPSQEKTIYYYEAEQLNKALRNPNGLPSAK